MTWIPDDAWLKIAEERLWIEDIGPLIKAVRELKDRCHNYATVERAMVGREESFRATIAELRKFGRHLRGCHIKPDNPIMRSLQPKGVPFVSMPCDCGFANAVDGIPTTEACRGNDR